MSKKNPKQKTKVIIVKGPKQRPFDLSLEKEGEAARVIEALTSLKHSSGWIYITQVFKANIKYLEECLIRGEAEGKPMTLAEQERTRDKRNFLVELLGKPDETLKRLTRTEDEEEPLDPYDRKQSQDE